VRAAQIISCHRSDVMSAAETRTQHSDGRCSLLPNLAVHIVGSDDTIEAHVCGLTGVEPEAGSYRSPVAVDQDRPSRFLAELDGSAAVADAATSVEPHRRVSSQRGQLVVSVGDVISATGGYEGVVTEITPTGVLVRLDAGGAILAISWGETVSMAGRSGRVAPGAGPADEGLFEQLKAWRLDKSRSQGVPAFVVFSDKTLEALASRQPSTPEGLLDIPGIGPAKLEAYGDDLLDLLANA